ncbi:hypothetical protein F6455_08695 [Proteobacteria bacterium 005FR1]|nr:hypothetical protein [Proteobacteria bacterium 005FR1]
MNEIWYSLEATELAFRVGATWWFPMIESIHVLTATLVLGSVFMVDLRLMGLAARRYDVGTLITELVPWTWLAFVLAVVTGCLLFIVQASSYASNTAFLIKMAGLVLAGLNMGWFHAYLRPTSLQPSAGATGRRKQWAHSHATVGALSLALWCGIMLAGRWIGHLV